VRAPRRSIPLHSWSASSAVNFSLCCKLQVALEANNTHDLEGGGALV
jgi:hypothetical protein